MIVIIAEKPKVANRIAKFLSNGKYYIKKFYRNVYFYEFYLSGEKVKVLPSIGHLFTLSDGKRSEVPSFNYRWVPAYIEDRIFIKKKYIEMLKREGEGADEYIVATDFDIEGELIGYNILRFIYGIKNGKRMVFSAITKKDITKAYGDLRNSIYYNLAIAGETRHIIDWIYGINLTRALSKCIKLYGIKKILSAGRVQSATLKFVYDKEIEIESFIPEIYYRPYIVIRVNNKDIKLRSNLKFKSREDAKKITEKIGNKIKKVKYTKTIEVLPPPHPYNLTDLQEDAYRYYKIDPSRTLKIAQSLYERGYISYPRTSSQRLPSTIDFRYIIRQLMSIKNYIGVCRHLLNKENLIPNNGLKDDIHPAIHPTGILPARLSKREFLIYDLIVRRFLATFMENARFVKENIDFEFGFSLENKYLITWGWLLAYKGFFDINLKRLEVKSYYEVIRKGVSREKTKPPSRYNPASLVRKMESENLGTKSTRAEIVRILFKRKYIEGRSIKITKLGKTIVNILSKYSPEVLSVNLTKKLEEELNKIENGDIERKDKVIELAKKTVKRSVENILNNCEEVGKTLAETLKIS